MLLFFALILLFDVGTYSQNYEIEKTQIRDSTSSIDKFPKKKYIGASFGLSLTNFRDLATSPLIYYGIAKHVSISRMKFGTKKECLFDFEYYAGSAVPAITGIDTRSYFSRLDIMHSQLFKINFLSGNKFKSGFGYKFDFTGMERENTSLLNNLFGFELIPTLAASYKITFDISRKEGKTINLLFFNRKLRPVKRNISLRIDVGVINSTYRNNYIYTSHSGVINDTNYFRDYKFSMFSGYRFGSGIDYTKYLNERNALVFSYLWDAFSTGGSEEKFINAMHIVRCTLLFNTNR